MISVTGKNITAAWTISEQFNALTRPLRHARAANFFRLSGVGKFVISA
jgi:hypothetical protein